MVDTATRPADPMDAAMEAKYDPTKTVFGQMDVDSYFGVFEKGARQMPVWDPAIHTSEQRKTSITLTMSPLPTSRFQNPNIKRLIAESAVWVKIVMPSLKALNADLRGLKLKWVQAELVPTGRKFTVTDQESGDEKEVTETTFKFTKIFGSYEECQAAADALFGKNDNSQPTPTMPANGDPNRAAFAKFLPMYWKQSGENPIKMAELIAADPNLSKHFNIDSPEVADIISPLPFKSV